ncbi:Putative Ring finger domain protein [Giardia duodenalis]|uniref:Putative Ring finger domain protein n=1 Tax=Giardia intestinalis TaxID=5741 RepID=V6TE45_GIAIN|nr:Putative Ring finger domain protein [Giardia intestinalis]
MPAAEASHWFEAARRGAVSFLLEHLEEHAGSFDSNGKTALMYLALHPIPPPDDLVAIEGSILDKDGHSALCYACRALNTDGIKRLWREEGCTFGLTALMLAVLSGNDPDHSTMHKDIRRQDSCGMTALMYAVVLGREQHIDLLWKDERGCADRQGRTALMLAVLCQNSYAFSKLHADPMEHGKLSNAKWSALGYAIVSNSLSFVQSLLPYEYAIPGAAYTLSSLSQRTNDAEIAKLVADDGLRFLVARKYGGSTEKIGVCIICLDEFCIVRSHPCGHRCTCYTCSQELQKRRLHNQCPLCRTEVEQWRLDWTVLADPC